MEGGGGKRESKLIP